MEGTGVFATKEEVEELKKLAKETANTPYMGLSCAHMMRGGFAGDAQQSMKERCHEVAMKHGLPEIQGFYGLKADGEFVKC